MRGRHWVHCALVGGALFRALLPPMFRVCTLLPPASATRAHRLERASLASPRDEQRHPPPRLIASPPYPTGAFCALATDADADQQRDDVEQLTKLTTG